MSEEFVKPKTIEVNFALRKNLINGEEICQYCNGIGAVIGDYVVYGLKGDPNKKAGMFPYNNQALKPCPYCFNGIVRRCEYCHKIIGRLRTKCDCATQKQIDQDIKNAKRQKHLQEAKEVSEENFVMLYTDDFNCGKDGFFEDWEEFFDAYEEAIFDDPTLKDKERPEYVWGTYSTNFKIDAYETVEFATEDLYEDAFDDISGESIKELQKYLDEWCKNCGVGETYYQDIYTKVRIPWEEYEGE